MCYTDSTCQNLLIFRSLWETNMIVLDSSVETLEVVLGGAVTTNELVYSVTYDESGTGVDERHSSIGLTTGATAVTVVNYPNRRDSSYVVVGLSVYNKDTETATVIVQVNVSGTKYQVISVSLTTGQTLSYARETGWQVLTTSGALKLVEALASPLPIADGGTAGATVAAALAALQLNQNAVTLLAEVTGIDAKTVAATTIYTVPSGKSLIVDHVSIRTTAFTAGSKSTQATASFGGNSATWDDYLNSVEYTIAANGVIINDSVLDTAFPVYAAAATFKLAIETGSDASTETWAVSVYGRLV